MNADELLDKFPSLLFSNFRNRMLLGKAPAQTVRTVLGPLLSNFQEVMLELPPELQTDFDNILRIYPDVAQSFGVRIMPPIRKSLQLFARHRFSAGRRGAPTSPELDMVAEPHQRMGGLATRFVNEGQGFFTTDRGSSVYLEFMYSEADDCAFFEYRPSRFPVKIHICGINALSLSPSEPKRKIPADRLFEILMQGPGGVSVEVIEG